MLPSSLPRRAPIRHWAEIAALVQEEAFDDLDAPIKRVASVEVPLPYSKPLELAALTGAKQLGDAIKELAPRRRR